MTVNKAAEAGSEQEFESRSDLQALSIPETTALAVAWRLTVQALQEHTDRPLETRPHAYGYEQGIFHVLSLVRKGRCDDTRIRTHLRYQAPVHRTGLANKLQKPGILL